MKTTPKIVKLYKESNEKTYHWCEGHREHSTRWFIHKTEDCRGLKKKQKEDGKMKNKSNNNYNNENQDGRNPI